jgi:O-antigen/teichoic acid export membrane protein
LGLLLSVAFAQLLTKELYGHWNYIFSITGILVIFTLPGMNTAIIQAVARGHDRVLIEGVKKRFKWSTLGSIGVLGVGIYYFLTGSIELGKSFMVFTLFLPFYENFQIYTAFLSGKKRFDKFAKYRIVTQIVSVLVTVMVMYFSRNLLLILTANLLSFSLLRGYFFRLTAKNIEARSDDPEAIPFGKRLTALQIPAIIREHYAKIIVGVFLSFQELAIYSIAFVIPHFLVSLLSHIVPLTFPKLAVMDEKRAYSEVKKRYIYLVLGSTAVSGIFILICPYILPFLYSQKYVDSVLYAQILLISVAFGIPTRFLQKSLLPAQKKVKEILKLRLVILIAEVILLIILISTLGLLGAVIARALVSVLSMVYSWRLMKWI